MKFKEKMASRKFWLACVVIIVATALLLLPAISIILLGKQISLITGTEFVSLVTLTIASYFGANTWEKKKIPEDIDIFSGVDEEGEV